MARKPGAGAKPKDTLPIKVGQRISLKHLEVTRVQPSEGGGVQNYTVLLPNGERATMRFNPERIEVEE
jgi:hypothetical protein